MVSDIELDDEDITPVRLNDSYVDLGLRREADISYVTLYHDEIIAIAKAMNIKPEDLKE